MRVERTEDKSVKQIYPALIITILLASPLLADRNRNWDSESRYRHFYQETQKQQLSTYDERQKADFGYHNTLNRSKSRKTEFGDYQDSSQRRGAPSFYSDSRDDNWRSRFYDSKVNDRPGAASVR